MNSLNFILQYDGSKNAVIRGSGYLSQDILEAQMIVKLSDLKCKALRIESLVFALQEKMGCVLWWMCEEGNYSIAPIEGKGQLNFEGLQGIHSPANGLVGIGITTFGSTSGKYILLMLDLTKQ